APFLRNYPTALRSIEVIDRAASGHGAINTEAEDGVVRNVPALARIGGHVVPGLAVEVLRQTSPDPIARVHVESRGLRRIEVAGHALPLDRDGTWWIHFSDPLARPIFPVESFLDGTLPADLITGRIVLIGVAASGLQDRVVTPVGPMPGVSVHAEALDNALDGRLLWRPHWAVGVEAGLLVLMGLICVVAVPALRPLNSVFAFALTLLLTGAIGVGAFLRREPGVRGDAVDRAGPDPASASQPASRAGGDARTPGAHGRRTRRGASHPGRHAAESGDRAGRRPARGPGCDDAAGANRRRRPLRLLPPRRRAPVLPRGRCL
ncbi:MAG: CHASE2 domain-containing protein, partial [Panacagrimonas sp.]